MEAPEYSLETSHPLLSVFKHDTSHSKFPVFNTCEMSRQYAQGLGAYLSS